MSVCTSISTYICHIKMHQLTVISRFLIFNPTSHPKKQTSTPKIIRLCFDSKKIHPSAQAASTASSAHNNSAPNSRPFGPKRCIAFQGLPGAIHMNIIQYESLIKGWGFQKSPFAEFVDLIQCCVSHATSDAFATKGRGQDILSQVMNFRIPRKWIY